MERQKEAQHQHMMNNFNIVQPNQADILGNMRTMQEQLQQMQISQNTRCWSMSGQQRYERQEQDQRGVGCGGTQ